MRRYWRSVKAGRRYRRTYSERHFSRTVVRRLRRAIPPARPRRIVRRRPVPPSVVPFAVYQQAVDQSVRPPVTEWHPHPTMEFRIWWALPTWRFGIAGRRRPTVPSSKFLLSRSLMVYFLVQRYQRGEIGWHIVGYRVVEPALPWRKLTLDGWWVFVSTTVWDYVLAYIDQRNQVEGSSWTVIEQPKRGLVLWHFVPED